MRQIGIYCAAALCVLGTSMLAWADDPNAEIADLKERVAKLEARLDQLEKTGQTAQSGSDVERILKAQQVAAKKRMQADRKKYSGKQLSEAEQLYQTANKDWRAPKAKESLEQMIKKFPDINRTGCAVLYLAQWSEGESREKLLKEAIDKYGDCYYGDGVQVGAFARYLLALYYLDEGAKDKAEPLLAELKEKFPQAVTHKGELLVVKLDDSQPN